MEDFGWRQLRALCAGAAWIALVVGPSAAWGQTPPPSTVPEGAALDYALPEQSLASALRAVAVRTGTDLIVASELVAGLRAAPLRGRFTPEQAVRALLEGSGLALRRVGASLVVVASAAEPAGSHRDASAGEPIVVTGTNLRGAQPAAKVVVLTRADIDRSGATSVDQLLRAVPQNTQGGTNKENALVVRPDSSTTDHGAGLNLRGLGQRATLVLVNGRRLAPSGTGAFVDVSLIPVTALDRVEILTDGASAIYGSDAVGGVVNLILRDRYEGAETTLQAGATTQGGGELLQVSQTFGTAWQGGHGLLSYEFRREDEIRVSQRSEPVGLRPGTFLFPRERRHSLLAAVGQAIAPGLTLNLTGSMARRTTARTDVPVVSNLPIGVRARANAYTASAGLDYALARGWRARLGGNYALADTSQRQTQPGGQALVNARDIHNWIAEASLKIDGTLVDLPGGPVRVALGGESRRESYREGFRSSLIAPSLKHGRRTVQSLYGEVLVPLLGPDNDVPGIERLQVSAAARYDRYSRTGSNLDPRFGVAWSPLPGLDLRGSFGTAFRAPLLAEAIGAYTVLLAPAPSFFVNPAQAPPGSIIALLQGSNPAVQPETSRNWSVGGEWAPPQVPGLALSLNYYRIRYSDRIDVEPRADAPGAGPNDGSNPHRLRPAASRWQVSAGSVIAASLITGLNSDLPGLIVAQVTEPVFDSATGRAVLIPQGARLLGRYESGIAFGQRRAMLVWQRLVLPDGASLALDDAPATDAEGYSGLADRVDFHTGQLLRGIAMSTLLGVGTELSFGDGEADLVRALRESVQTGADRAGQKIVERNLDIAPTITVRPGFPVRVLVHKDLVLPPWKG